MCLSTEELYQINGGGDGGKVKKIAKVSIWGYVIEGIISNWAEVKQAAVDGWNLK